MTAGQKRAIDRHWPRFGLGPPPAPRVPAGAGSPVEAAATFGRRAPLVAEIGFGRGDALLDAAAARPDRDFVGIEVHAPGVGYLLARLHERGIENVRVLFADAREALRHRFPDRSLDEIRILFPDPWPKARHHKRRLVQAGFADLAAARLRCGGRLLAATDDEDYAHHMLAVFEATPLLENLAGPGAFWSGPTERLRTRFEERGHRHGSTIRDLRFERVRAAGARATRMNTTIDRGLLDAVRRLAAAAADRILRVYDSPFEVERKADASPLTEADLASHRIIVAGLRDLAPAIPVLSEESAEIDFATRAPAGAATGWWTPSTERRTS